MAEQGACPGDRGPSGRPPHSDAKLEALRAFVVKVVSSRGWPAEKDIQAFLDAAFTRCQKGSCDFSTSTNYGCALQNEYSAKPRPCLLGNPLRACWGEHFSALGLLCDLETTLSIYTHAVPESNREAVEKLGGFCSQMFPTSSPLKRVYRLYREVGLAV
jgi:hypothetical protein